MSASPGWYPDPEDRSRARYWDGSAWAPTGGAPGGGGPGGGSGRGWWWVIGAIVVAVALVAVLLVPRLLAGGDDVAQPDPEPTGPRPTESQWDELPDPETPTPSPTPSDSPSTGEEIECPTGEPDARTSTSDSEWIRGGGIAVPVPTSDGWTSAASTNLSWAHDVDGIQSNGAFWYNPTMVGQLRAEDGFTDVKQAAHVSLDCQASPMYYGGNAPGLEITVDEPYELDGVQGWHVQGLVITDRLTDRVDVFVFDDGEGNFSTVQATVNHDEANRVAEVDEMLAGMRLEG